jgi:hypothetical protein
LVIGFFDLKVSCITIDAKHEIKVDFFVQVHWGEECALAVTFADFTTSWNCNAT